MKKSNDSSLKIGVYLTNFQGTPLSVKMDHPSSDGVFRYLTPISCCEPSFWTLSLYASGPYLWLDFAYQVPQRLRSSPLFLSANYLHFICFVTPWSGLASSRIRLRFTDLLPCRRLDFEGWTVQFESSLLTLDSASRSIIATTGSQKCPGKSLLCCLHLQNLFWYCWGLVYCYESFGCSPQSKLLAIASFSASFSDAMTASVSSGPRHSLNSFA